jgi:hypothetical protein
MLKDLNKEELKLAEYMSSISEKGFSAAWLEGLEFDLWKIVIGGNRRYGRYDLTEFDINRLKLLSQQCKSWIVFDEFHEETAIKLTTWDKLYEARRS